MFESQVRRFRYAESLIDIELQPSSERVWAEMEEASRRENDLERAQTIQDISWVLTQVEPGRRETLWDTRDAIERLLKGTYGPYVLGLCAEMGLTLEGFVLPLAKAEPDLGMAGRKRRRFTTPRMQYPPPIFAAVFAKHWVGQLLSPFPIQEVRETNLGGRVWVGWVSDCPACDDRGVIEEELDRRVEDTRMRALENARGFRESDEERDVPEDVRQRLLAFLGLPRGDDDESPARQPDLAWREALDTPLTGNPQKTVRDLLSADNEDGKVDSLAAVALFGDELVCKECGRWIDLPPGVHEGWICPIVNGDGDRFTWRRVTIR